MTSIEDLTLRLQEPGYWAMEVRLSDGHGVPPQFLIHAINDREAGRIAVRLMGSTPEVRGFNYYRLYLPILNRAEDGLPAMGSYEAVEPDAWSDLMLARATDRVSH